MKLKFLGTAAAEGIPALACNCKTCERARKLGGKEIRTRSQAIINDCVMIDFPADTYMHILKSKINLCGIQHYVITHAHSDHFYPAELEMFGAGFAHYPENVKEINFYGGSEIEEKGKGFAAKIVKFHTLEPFKTYDIGPLTITPLKATHGTLTPFIYIIEDGEKRMLYAHDTGFLPAETEEYLFKNKPHFDLISYDCCCGTWKLGNYGGHLCFEGIKKISQNFRENGLIDDKTVLCVNHFSHNATDVLYKKREVYEKDGYVMSYDGLEIEF